MAAIQNQQTGLTYLLKLGGQEITEHNRKITTEVEQSGSDVELARGNIKRYVKKNKKRFSISFSYLPTLDEKTVDGRKGRDYLLTAFKQKGPIELLIKLDPNDEYKTYTCFFNSYSETLIKRDITTGCAYYDVSIDLGEQ